MIAYLQGKILNKTASYLVLQTGDTGYKLFTTPEILDKPLGSQIEVYIFHKVSEDAQVLYALPNFETLQFFELLISVSGVGPKAALTIVSAAKLEILQSAILSGDTGIFTRMSGVGKKTAERIILELKNKLSGGILLSGELTQSSSELYDALIGLGYNPREAREVVPQIDSSLDTAEQIKQALKLISKSR